MEACATHDWDGFGACPYCTLEKRDIEIDLLTERIEKCRTTLRDNFAGMAMQGLISQFRSDNVSTQALLIVARKSYLMADAMIGERKKETALGAILRRAKE